MKHITGKAMCWAMYWIVLSVLIAVGVVTEISGRAEEGAEVNGRGTEERYITYEEEEAEAITSEEEKDEAQIFKVEIRSTPTPIATKRPEREIDEYPKNYDIDEKDIECISKLLWSSPLRSESSKRTLVWVVLNRVDDTSGEFGNSIKEVVKKSEFSFYDKKAHVSDKNKAIVREVMQAWRAEKDGYYVGRHCPKNGVYIRFEGESNRSIEVTGTIGGIALEW